MKTLKRFFIVLASLLLGFVGLAQNPSCLVGDPSTYINIDAPSGADFAVLSDFIAPSGPLPAGGGNSMYW